MLTVHPVDRTGPSGRPHAALQSVEQTNGTRLKKRGKKCQVLFEPPDRTKAAAQVVVFSVRKRFGRADFCGVARAGPGALQHVSREPVCARHLTKRVALGRVVLLHVPLQLLRGRRTNQTQDAREYSHDGPIRRRTRGYILTTDQSDARRAGLLSRRTHRTQDPEWNPRHGRAASSPPYDHIAIYFSG
eukprot:5516480-Pyramimonas_sp.AAC.1